MRYFTLSIILLSFSNLISQKKNNTFSGELTYKIERIDVKDTIKSVQFIYAKDSLLKIVSFNSELGKQELIKHLTYGKSYILIETPLQNFAIKTDSILGMDLNSNYTFSKKSGKVKIAGLKTKKLSVKLNMVENELTFLYYDKIPAKYLNTYINLPGLPVLYYVANENGLYRYTLDKIKKTNPPLQLFMIPENFKKVTFKQFDEEFSKFYDSID